VRVLLGTGSYELFTLDKLLVKLVKHLALTVADEASHRLWDMYRYEAARSQPPCATATATGQEGEGGSGGSGVTAAAAEAPASAVVVPLTQYHINCHTVMDDTCYRIEFKCVIALFLLVIGPRSALLCFDW
jgi:hypothetical protein